MPMLPVLFGIEDIIPCAAERVADNQSRGHGEKERGDRMAEPADQKAADKRRKNESDNVAARISHKNAGAAPKTGKHRQAERAEHYVKNNGQRAAFGAEEADSGKYRKRLHGKGDGCGYSNPRADRDQCGGQRGLRQAFHTHRRGICHFYTPAFLEAV